MMPATVELERAIVMRRRQHCSHATLAMRRDCGNWRPIGVNSPKFLKKIAKLAIPEGYRKQSSLRGLGRPWDKNGILKMLGYLDVLSHSQIDEPSALQA